MQTEKAEVLASERAESLGGLYRAGAHSLVVPDQHLELVVTMPRSAAPA